MRLEVKLHSGPVIPERSPQLSEFGGGREAFRSVSIGETEHHAWLVTLTLEIVGPELWWKQASPYFPEIVWLRARPEASETERRLTQGDFEEPVPQRLLQQLNDYIAAGDRVTLRSRLPESFLRRAVVHTNLQTLYTIQRERGHYEHGHWHLFCRGVESISELSTLLTHDKETIHE